MFGDVGHGFLMLLFSLYLVLNEKALGRITLNEMVDMCFGGALRLPFPALSVPSSLYLIHRDVYVYPIHMSLYLILPVMRL